MGNFFFFIQSGPDQKEISETIISNLNKNNYMDLSNMSVREIMPYYFLCDMYVGNDSFMHHVTSQSNKPAVVIMLNSPSAYTDYSKNYYRIVPPGVKLNEINHNSFYSRDLINVEMVKQKILEIKSKQNF